MAEEEINNSEPDEKPITWDQSLIEEFQSQLPDEIGETHDIKEVWRHLKDLPLDEAPSALCLSGGGIRSATFCLGVMQGLAQAAALGRFQYLSTVSGGGYVGSWLSRWRADKAGWTEADMRETPHYDAGVEPTPFHPIRRLRSFSNYLAPIGGVSIDSLSLATIFLRNLLISLLVWVPLILALAWLPRFVVAWFRPLTGLCPSAWRETCGANVAGFAAASAPVLLGAVWLLIAAILLAARKRGEAHHERASRLGAWLLLCALAWILWFGLFIFAPMLAWEWLRPRAAEAGLLSAGLAIVTGLGGYWSRYGPRVREKVQGIAEQTGLRLLDLIAAAVLAVIALWAAIAVHMWIDWTEGADPGSYKTLLESGPTGRILVPGLLVLAALLVAWAAGANRFSLHSLYGNRLVRAYLGSARKVRTPERFTDFDPDDNIPLAELHDGGPLFHVINMTLNLARSGANRRDWQERKAASFTATPLRCGSAGLGFAPSATYAGGITLGRAMTISGAAASPSMGYHSSPLVALVMTLFNIRLGWWLPNPRLVKGGGTGTPIWKRSEPASGWLQMVREGLSRTSDDSAWLYLSDGGHFENLGLYEMVRRRCRRIVVVDATCDGDFSHADLHNAARKIKVDFGIPIDLPPTLPGQPGPGWKQRVVVGRIRYSAIGDNYPDGILFCLKPILTGGEPPSLTHYAATSRRRGNTFPHHSTADQFFNETQFESYRLLGEVSGRELLPHLSRDPSVECGSEVDFHYPGLDRNDEEKSATPAKEISAPTEPPPSALTGAGQIAERLQSLGTSGLVATGLTAVATIGVAGTLGLLVTLKLVAEPLNMTPAVVSLAQDDRQLLKDGLQLKQDQETVSLLRELSGRVEQLIRALPGTDENPSPPDLSALVEQIRVLNSRIEALIGRPSGSSGPSAEDRAQLTAISNRVDEILARLRQPSPPTQQDITQIMNQLEQLRRQIRSSGSRTNVRGQ